MTSVRKAQGILRKVRTAQWYKLVARELDAVGASYKMFPPPGVGHPVMIVEYRGATLRMTVPCTPSGSASGKQYAVKVRRFIELTDAEISAGVRHE